MEAIMTVKKRHTIKQLLQLSKYETNKHIAVRIQTIALAMQDLTCPQLVEMTGYPRRTIQRWVAKYNDESIDGLVDKSRTGRPTKLSVGKQGQFCKCVDAGPTGTTATLYGMDIRQILRRNFGVVYTLDGVYKLLHRLGYSCLKPRPRHEKADPLIQEEFKKTWVKGLKTLLKSTPISE
jgi:transposase